MQALYSFCYISWPTQWHPRLPSSKRAISEFALSCAAWATRVACRFGAMAARRSAAKSKAGKGDKGSSKASSSGCSSPRSTTSSPERVGKYDLSHLPRAWDNNDAVRDRLRDDKALLLHVDELSEDPIEAHVDGVVADVKCNKHALVPLAEVMATNQLLMPNICRLIEAVEQVYKLAKKPRSFEHSYQMAWAFRRLLVCLKSFCYRDNPPEESQLK